MSPHRQPSPDDARPTLAITLGDPLGIGPEIIVKALADRSLRRAARFRVHGTAAQLDAAARRAGIDPYWWRVAHDSDVLDAGLHHDVLVIDHPELELGDDDRAVRTPSKPGGIASFRFVEDAIRDALLPAGHPRRVDGIVTAPISKTSWRMAGGTARKYPGHTELLADRFKARKSGMLFVGPHLRVVLATIHVPLMSVAGHLTVGRVLESIGLAHQSCVDLGIGRPRIAVCGLNPHAGEGGLLGEEDGRVIKPAVDVAVRDGIDAVGPLPADTLFGAAAAPPVGKGRYDCVVAMFHDQGLIPVKLVDGERAVNVTAGLPTVRTSPAHGTAFDIAGQNKASPVSMREAIELAIKLVGLKAAGPAR